MNPFRPIWRRLRSLGQRRAVKQEIDEELRFHIEQRTAENIAKGMTPEDAAREARKRFGNVQSVREACREVRGASFGEALLQDIRFGMRMLGKHPGFTAAAVTVLVLGIGLNSAMFIVVHALAFSARPFAAPARVVQLYTQDEKNPSNFRAFSYTAYRELRARTDLFAGVLAHNPTVVGIGEGAYARRAFSAIVSANYFEVLGAPLVRGRAFTAAEASPGYDLPVVVASHLFWKKSGLKPDLVGSTVRINGRLFTVVGITPEGFTGTMTFLGPELYFPLGVFDTLDNEFGQQAARGLEQPGAYNLFLVARLAPGVTAAAATTALAGLADGMERIYPAEHGHQNFILGPLPRLGTSTSPSDDSALTTLSLMLMSLSAIVLLIVCLNLASLLLARGHARRKEFAIRLALGGGRARIVRQLLTEGFLLSLAGGALGVVLAVWSCDLLVGSVAARLPVAIFFSGAVNAAVLITTLGLCALATLFFAFGPALKLTRADVLTDLKAHAADDVVEPRHRWLPRHPLVVLQLALTLALLIAGGLFVRLAHRAVNFDPGYRADDTLIAEVDASLGGYDEIRATQLYRDIGERLSALPGVQSASVASTVPFGFKDINRPVQRAGFKLAPDARPSTAAEGRAYNARWNSIGADYFATLGLPLLQGRAFTRAETDTGGGPTVAIIDEVLARKLWPDGDALGQRLQWGDRENEQLTLEIVGIVAATRATFTQKEPGNAIYVPFAQGFMSGVHFHVRTAGAAFARSHVEGLVDAVRREIRAAAPGVPIFKVRTFAQHRDASMGTWALRMGASLFSTFGILALLVALVGIYGIKACAVARRTREIGIRLALGATPAGVQGMILGEGLVMTLAGTALGLLLGAGIGRVLGSLFTDLAPFDPLAFGFAALSLAAAALLACWLPARRAAKVDPMEALRYE